MWLGKCLKEDSRMQLNSILKRQYVTSRRYNFQTASSSVYSTKRLFTESGYNCKNIFVTSAVIIFIHCADFRPNGVRLNLERLRMFTESEKYHQRCRNSSEIMKVYTLQSTKHKTPLKGTAIFQRLHHNTFFKETARIFATW